MFCGFFTCQSFYENSVVGFRQLLEAGASIFFLSFFDSSFSAYPPTNIGRVTINVVQIFSSAEKVSLFFDEIPISVLLTVELVVVTLKKQVDQTLEIWRTSFWRNRQHIGKLPTTFVIVLNVVLCCTSVGDTNEPSPSLSLHAEYIPAKFVGSRGTFNLTWSTGKAD